MWTCRYEVSRSAPNDDGFGCIGRGFLASLNDRTSERYIVGFIGGFAADESNPCPLAKLVISKRSVARNPLSMPCQCSEKPLSTSSFGYQRISAKHRFLPVS
jgi:hypothetical protein